jgi:hypothetical protein
MLRTRYNYWACSKFADWIRGEKKPYALELGAWDDYYSDLKKRKPIRYWITEKFLKTLQNIVYFPYDIYNTIDCYVRNRWIDKTHMIDTGFKPGGFYEIDQKILHGLFKELVDFVEKDLARMGSYCDKNVKYKFHRGRCVEAAYAYFKWAGKLRDVYPDGSRKSSEQAKTSRKIKKLYEWWTNVRPNRVDPYEDSGWNKFCNIDENKLFNNKKETPQEIRRMNQAINRLAKIEEKHDNEDTNMLIELIKIRRHLWS